jgi:hypothetical protein
MVEGENRMSEKMSFENAPGCHSGSRLDEFCAVMLNFKHGGTYVDIGSAHSKFHNNSHFLDTKLGWTGLCVELESRYNDSYTDRMGCTYINGDATKLDYAAAFETLGMPKSIDFLSLDVDVLDLEVAKLVLNTDYRFKVIGIEHDAYQYGSTHREPQREFILSKGYALVCSDVFVRHPDFINCPFEDWYLDPQQFDSDVIARVKSDACYPEDILAKL